MPDRLPITPRETAELLERSPGDPWALSGPLVGIAGARLSRPASAAGDAS